MAEASESRSGAIRPTKKQRELLDFIESFIEEHGYSPSYREIMNGLNYNSVATVALHVGSLIKRGHLRKREHSARSLEVVQPGETIAIANDGQTAGSHEVGEAHEKWLVERVENHLRQSVQENEADGQTAANNDDAQLLLDALRILGLGEQADNLQSQLIATEAAPAR